MASETTWDALIAEFIEWTMATFPKQTEASALLHFFKEVEELRENFDATGGLDVIEAVDCVMLLLASAHSGLFDFKREFAEKLAVNKARQWGEPDADGVVEHVRVLCARCGYSERDPHHDRALWEQMHEDDGREMEWCTGFKPGVVAAPVEDAK